MATFRRQDAAHPQQPALHHGLPAKPRLSDAPADVEPRMDPADEPPSLADDETRMWSFVFEDDIDYSQR